MQLIAAGKYKAETQAFPALLSAKIDGVRCWANNGVATSRSMKPIPNLHVQAEFAKHADILHNFDGELIVGKPYSTGETVMTPVDGGEIEIADCPFNRTSGAVRRKDGNPEFTYFVFDFINDTLTYEERYNWLMDAKSKGKLPEWVEIVGHRIVNSHKEVLEIHNALVGEGYEGAMLRSLNGKYKHGRSTTKEGILLKVKLPTLEEAEIVEVVEEMMNLNAPLINTLGHTERSSHKENKVGKNRAGALKVKMISGRFAGSIVSVGSGFDEEMRNYLWENREKVIGKIIRVEYFDIGAKFLPRFPVMKGFREKWDM